MRARVLAGLLDHYRGRSDVIVLGLPRGGVPVAYEIAQALGAPLDVFVVRKLGVPGREELAMGAIASGGVVVINDDGAVALAEGGHGRRRVVCCSNGQCEFGEGCWESVVGVEVNGQFVVSAAQVLDERMSCADHLG